MNILKNIRWELSGLFICIAMFIGLIGYYFGYESGLADGWKFAKEDSVKQKYESIKLGDKNTKVIIDDQTGCRYIVFNNKTLTPLYDKKGEVYGCGKVN